MITIKCMVKKEIVHVGGGGLGSRDPLLPIMMWKSIDFGTIYTPIMNRDFVQDFILHGLPFHG